jgi:hypothetical protein
MANKTYLGGVHEQCPIQKEAPAGATLTPGMLAIVSGGELIPHDTAGAGGFVYVAKELTGSFDDGGSINTDYAAGETAQAYVPTSGDLFQMLVADGQTVGYDTALESNGAGLLVVATTGDVIAYADEDAGTTSGTTPVRVKFK